ncbi:MAG: LysM peptidoglycan-binding domain-containing protein [Defluviitaleaceae bacterium]|nr:LysM peptidoglycan-binding domain-containing protein [Defluviitaleaceae bacterium]
MRDQEKYGYNRDDIDHNHHDDYDNYDDYDDTSKSPVTDYKNSSRDDMGNEMARNAVGRFLDSEADDNPSGYDGRRKERPAPRPLDPRDAEPTADTWRPTSPPNFEDDAEFLSQLANARRDRPRRGAREANPMPKPAVRVNAERRRRTPPHMEHYEASPDESAPMDDEDFSNFRNRYSAHDVISTPKETREKETRVKEARDGGTVAPIAVHRREAAASHSPSEGDGANPLRYLLAIVLVGVLALMAFLAFNNRNLRRDLYAAQAQVNEADDSAGELERLNLELNGYRADLTEARVTIEDLEAQLGAQGYASTTEDDPYANEETPNRPNDETTPEEPPQPPPTPDPVIHIVQPGEVLSRIANQHYGSSAQIYIDKIVAANDHLTNANAIQPGQELVIPPRE